MATAYSSPEHPYFGNPKRSHLPNIYNSRNQASTMLIMEDHSKSYDEFVKIGSQISKKNEQQQEVSSQETDEELEPD